MLKNNVLHSAKVSLIHKEDWLKKKATFLRSEKAEMIFTFQRNRHSRKVSLRKTFTHVLEHKN